MLPESPESAESPEELHSRALELLTAGTHGRLSFSMRALPFMALARHIVTDGRVLVRLHAGFGCHRACDGNVVAYGSDNLAHRSESVWSVQFVGTARVVEPGPHELELFGRAPLLADGARFDPAYLRIEPRFATVQTLGGVLQ